MGEIGSTILSNAELNLAHAFFPINKTSLSFKVGLFSVPASNVGLYSSLFKSMVPLSLSLYKAKFVFFASLVNPPAEKIASDNGLLDLTCFVPGNFTSPITITEIVAGEKLDLEIFN